MSNVKRSVILQENDDGSYSLLAFKNCSIDRTNLVSEEALTQAVHHWLSEAEA